MRILALETSATAGSVAALEDDALLAQLRLDPALRSAKSLAPALAELLLQVGWQSTAVELVAVTSGPGSFTGLRIGVTTAKAFAYAVGCQVVGVNTLEVIAAQATASNVTAAGGRVWSAIDAERQQFFVAQFGIDRGGQLNCLVETHLVEQQTWLAGLQAGEVISGPGLARTAQSLPPAVIVESQDHWQPLAETVGRLGYRAWLAGRRDTPLTLLPQYFRRTAAEEQWEKRGTRSAKRGTEGATAE